MRVLGLFLRKRGVTIKWPLQLEKPTSTRKAPSKMNVNNTLCKFCSMQTAVNGLLMSLDLCWINKGAGRAIKSTVRNPKIC